MRRFASDRYDERDPKIRDKLNQPKVVAENAKTFDGSLGDKNSPEFIKFCMMELIIDKFPPKEFSTESFNISLNFLSGNTFPLAFCYHHIKLTIENYLIFNVVDRCFMFSE